MGRPGAAHERQSAGRGKGGALEGTRLEGAFVSLLREAGADLAEGDARARPLFRELAEAYSGEGRFYHDLRHVEEVLGHIDRHADAFAGKLADAVAARLAAFFHDAVYDTTAGDNEERSADRAARALGELGVPAGTVERVRRLVLATKAGGRSTPDDAPFTARLFVDCDMAILGAPPGRYDEYAADVRREYACYDDESFRAGRRAFLEGVLARPRIFLTDEVASALELRARENVSREIARL